jgi:hypothetical protein
MTKTLSKVEREICAQMRLGPEDYRAAKMRRNARSVNATGRGFGSKTRDEKIDTMRASGELPARDDDVEPEALAEQAASALELFLQNPSDDAAYDHLAAAAAFLEEALDRVAPSYADRHENDGADDDGDDDEDESADSARALRNPFAPRASHGRGGMSVRGSDENGARIERLTRAEVAVCAQMNLRPEDYAKARTRRGIAIG